MKCLYSVMKNTFCHVHFSLSPPLQNTLQTLRTNDCGKYPLERCININRAEKDYPFKGNTK